ncbi:MAG: M6 family metalloprotease domain-containing protein [Muribaculaceae bacterium]|nr:M6 family metalloprotease domain-containing protein [Muribaculaceae bacterium]
MKKILSIACMMWCALCIFRTGAVPAYPHLVAVTQPDGSTVTLQLHGDEFYHFTTTADGYTVLKNQQGTWEYARLDAGYLVSTGVQVHDATARGDSERALLATLGQYLTDREQVGQSKAQRVKRDRANVTSTPIDQSEFRGLVILVNYKDVKFNRSDAHDFYDRMVNERNYTGYVNEDGTVDQWCQFTGSVHDYFYDQSGGRFEPEFDIVGPVEINYSAYDAGSHYRQIFQSVLMAANSQVDFSIYDNNSDGVVDNVFFLVAGWGANYTGNSDNLLWPHENNRLMSIKLDGVSFDTYACSTEMLSPEGNVFFDGIGSICHEFSHVLGLVDLYDTDYNDSGGRSHDPSRWDVMALGYFNNEGRTPAAYTLYERYALGWATPTELNEVGDYTLQALEQSNQGFRLNTGTDNEYFLLENRQPVKWDAALPGHGMLIFRVDSTNVTVWEQNQVNCDPAHNYYELLRAGGSTSGDNGSDPYPGSNEQTICSNYKLCSWSGEPSPWMLTDITEADDGTITFGMMDVSQMQTLVETFDRMEVTTANSEQTGDIATWKLIGSKVQSVDDGKQVALFYPSNITMTTPVSRNITRVSFEVSNTSSTEAHISLFYSTDGGNTWSNATDDQGNKYYAVAGNSKNIIDWMGAGFGASQQVRFRIGMILGNKTIPCRVDNFTLYYNDSEAQTGDLNGDGTVDVTDINTLINIILGKSEQQRDADINGDGTVDVTDVNMLINIILRK